ALALAGPSGGTDLLKLGVSTKGGFINVFSTGGGTARAGLSADATTGAVIAYNAAGQPVAVLGSPPAGSGQLPPVNGPAPVVQAGSTPDGVGLVRAGPVYGAANQIVGRKGQ